MKQNNRGGRGGDTQLLDQEGEGEEEEPAEVTGEIYTPEEEVGFRCMKIISRI